MRSKAVWGYGDAELASFHDELRLRPEDVERRRTIVAERDGAVVGVATLDGDPPDGGLGLLFVDDGHLRRGLGTALYQRILAEAGRLGHRRVRIDADPHAVPFYRAVGAEPISADGDPAGALVRLQAWPVEAPPPWSVVWNSPVAPAVVGNVAEFNGQFGGRPGGPDHYSCLAAVCARRPGMVLLPAPVPGWWADHLADVLGWTTVPVHGGLAEDGQICEAITARTDLTGSDTPMLSWGATPGTVRLGVTSPETLRCVRRYESKRHAHRLFEALAAGHPRILVPEQQPLRSAWRQARELADGRRVVLKQEFGVGGQGVVIVSRETPGLRSLLRRSVRAGALVERFVDGDPANRDVTFDALVAPDGRVWPVGAGSMMVDGVAYRGVTVGPGVLPAQISAVAADFGLAVGRALAEEGYRGWYDVDYVATVEGMLAPTEINLRLSGPAVAWHVQVALDQRWGGSHVVRTLDLLPLGARLPGKAFQAHVALLEQRCRSVGARLLVTIASAAFDPAPYLAVALAGRTVAVVDAAENAVRRLNAGLGELFSDLHG